MRWMRRRWLAVVAAAVTLLTLTAFGPGGHTETTYEPPFEVGPSGGDQWNHVSADPQGRVTVGRAYPVPGSISCPAKAGYAKLVTSHTAHGPVETVTVAFSEAAVDPYTFATVGVRDANGTWLGYRDVRGVVAGDGQIEVPVAWPRNSPTPRTITVQFGLQLSSACPSADAGTLRFTHVTVTESSP